MFKKAIKSLKEVFQSEKQKETEYYKKMFVENSYWNTTEPNEEEKIRWEIIEDFLQYLKSKDNSILDLGCGRGWLTNLLTSYGYVTGVEPIKPVVEYAKKIFPEINFICGTTKDLLKKREHKKFDLVVSSEVIEHIPNGYKSEFIDDIFKLLKSEGYLIITTPRKEVQKEWVLYTNPNQPVEDWISESELEKLVSQRGFKKIKVERFSISPKKDAPKIEIYQLWLFQKEEK
jgi:2-polyprenyl-3-methyl-5-hydroxy-6-metoxy-1,4-benzoquinol methylase